jgi:hypothetical protein
MIERLRKWLALWMTGGARSNALEHLPVDELRHIKEEADYISAAVDSTEGLLKPDDMERLKTFTRKLEEINKGRKPN